MSWLLKGNKPYIKDHQIDLVKKHKYQGACLSYSYILFYSPISDYLVTILPRWIAPNAISFLGFLFNFIPHFLIVLLYGDGLDGELPPWFCITLGVSYFLYMVCDNTDGKQARKTGTSSPLGMLLDHGIDSVTAVINNFIIQRLFNIGNSYMCIIGMFVSTMPFYYAIIEQYYTGELILQVVNGVDDGSFVYIFWCFLSAYYGCTIWQTEYSLFGLPAMPVSNIAMWVLLAWQIISSLDNLRGIYAKRSCKQFQMVYRPAYFTCHVLWFFINGGIFLVAACYSAQNIMETHPRRVMYAFGFQFIILSLRIQLSGVTHDIFNPFRRTNLLTWALLIANTIFAVQFNKSIMDEPTMYLIIDVFSFISMVHIIINVATELQSILKINLLTLTKKQLEDQKTIKYSKDH